MSRERSRILAISLAIGMAVVLLPSSLLPISTLAAAPGATAADGPGALSHFDLARKDCLGTARNTTSKVWYTVANGVLSDVYFPTADNTNVETLQFVVTDGKTFTDLQSRDTTYTVQSLDARSLDCRTTSTAKSGRYQIVTDYLTDPSRNTVVMRTKFTPLIGDLATYNLYVRYDPSINGNGGGGAGNGGGDTGIVDTSTGHALPVAFDTNTASQASNRTYATPVFSALDASTPFTQVSNGFAGAASDGLRQLDGAHSLTATFANATNGNLVQTTAVNLSRGGNFTIALGFGTTQADATAAAEGTLSTISTSSRRRTTTHGTSTTTRWRLRPTM